MCAESELIRRRDAKLLAEKLDLKTPTRDIISTSLQTLLDSYVPFLIALPILIVATQEPLLTTLKQELPDLYTCKSKYCYALDFVPSVLFGVVCHSQRDTISLAI